MQRRAERPARGYAPYGLCLVWLLSFLFLGGSESAGAEPEYVWELVTDAAPWAPRDGAGALTFRGQMWLLGGWNPSAAHRSFFPRICNNEVWSSPDGTAWTLVKPNTFVDRSFETARDWEGR
ncbi:MAG: hypothetical protein AB7F89_21000, partial [Pirellulaceae bacterium]